MTQIKEVIPYLCVRGAPEAIEFYRQAFGAQEQFRLAEPNGKVAHAELLLGDVTLMLADEHPDAGFLSPLTLGGTGSAIHLQVNNADLAAQRAVAAGAVILCEPADQFYGERTCKLRDPFGHEWLLAHEIEAVTVDEMQRRFLAMFPPA